MSFPHSKWQFRRTRGHPKKWVSDCAMALGFKRAMWQHNRKNYYYKTWYRNYHIHVWFSYRRYWVRECINLKGYVFDHIQEYFPSPKNSGKEVLWNITPKYVGYYTRIISQPSFSWEDQPASMPNRGSGHPTLHRLPVRMGKDAPSSYNLLCGSGYGVR